MSAARQQPSPDLNPVAQSAPPGPASLPALAAALRHSARRASLAAPWPALIRYDALVPMYRVPVGEPAQEATAAAHVLLAVADRLRRLTAAYHEWPQFDASAFFDLSQAQTARLVHIVERVATVHVTFYADQLLPSFAQAAAFWQQEFRPAYWELRAHLRDGHPTTDQPAGFASHCLSRMVEHWRQAVHVATLTRDLLDEEIGYWAANGAGEERGRYRAAWQVDPAPGLDPALLPDLEGLPTLTLAVDFPLPAARQAGRRRRLQRLQMRRRAGRLRARSA